MSTNGLPMSASFHIVLEKTTVMQNMQQHLYGPFKVINLPKISFWQLGESVPKLAFSYELNVYNILCWSYAVIMNTP